MVIPGNWNKGIRITCRERPSHNPYEAIDPLLNTQFKLIAVDSDEDLAGHSLVRHVPEYAQQ